MNILSVLRNCIWKVFHRIHCNSVKKNLHNANFSIVCNNCVGAMVMHDLGQRLNTPTVNLFIKPDDYIEFLSHLDDYLKADITDITGNNEYPIGLLGGKIHLYFLHYKNFEEAKSAWTRRRGRINRDNLYVVFVERDGCTLENLQAFDNLPFKNKVALVHKPYPNIKCSYVFPGYESDKEVGFITDATRFNGKHIYDKFNWVKFLNK